MMRYFTSGMNRSAVHPFRHNAATPDKNPKQKGVPMTMQGHVGLDTRRYNAAATGLHWIIAVLIVIQIGLGWYMNEVLPDHSPAHDQILTLHVSVGITILLLVLARIAVRLMWRPPPMPSGLPALD